MGAPAQYEQQMIQEPAPQVVIEVPENGGDALIWATGVVVPIVIAIISAWAGRKNAYIAAALQSEKGTKYMERVKKHATKRAQEEVAKRVKK